MITDFLYIGHRGTRVDFDENSILGFRKAIEYGADYIEFDLRKTKDGKLVVLHDLTLDRTTSGSGLLQKLTFKELKNFKTKIQKVEIPSLKNVFDALKGKTKFMIELKESSLYDDAVKIIKKYNLLKDCVISGRILSELLEFKEIHPQSKICYNISKAQGLTIKKFLNLSKREICDLDIDLINLRSSLISKEFIERCHECGIISLTWDFLNYKNPLSKIKSLIRKGIDGVLFDNYRNILVIKKWQNHFKSMILS